MINHVRTLLANRDPGPVRGLGDEAVDPKFRRRKLPTNIHAFLHTLIPTESDQIFKNCRLAVLLNFLHDTRATYSLMTCRDRRLTYSHPLMWFKKLPRYGAAVNPPARGLLEVVNDLPAYADAATGRSTYDWFVVYLANTVTVNDMVTGVTLANAEIVLSNGVSNEFAVPLDTGSLRLRMRLPPGETQASWRFVLDLVPATPLLQLLDNAYRVLGDGTAADIMRKTAAPFPKLKYIWENSEHKVTRYAALLLAVAYAIEDLPPEVS